MQEKSEDGDVHNNSGWMRRDPVVEDEDDEGESEGREGIIYEESDDSVR